MSFHDDAMKRTNRAPSACSPFARREPVVGPGAESGRERTARCSCLFFALLWLFCGSLLQAQDELSPPAESPPLVTPEVEKAVSAGIAYLLSVRADDGQWWAETPSGGNARRGDYPCANTALVGLSLLAAGSMPTRGPHANLVKEITDQLLLNSTETGLLTSSRGDEPRTMYAHAFAMTFLATVFGQEGGGPRREAIRNALSAAVTLCEQSQTYDGGWAYTPNFHEDEGTLVVTQLLGLRACNDAGVPVAKQVIDDAVGYIRKSATPSGQVMYRIGSRQFRPGVTCAAVVALWNAGEYDSPLMKRIYQFVRRRIEPNSGALWEQYHHGEYVEFFLALALWLKGDRGAAHYKRIAASLLRSQRPDGSWRGSDNHDYGVVYSTCMALLILQMPYERLPIYAR